MKRAHDDGKAEASSTSADIDDASAAATSAAVTTVDGEAPPPISQLMYANLWYFVDMQENLQGPFSSYEMHSWFGCRQLPETTQVAPSWYGEVPATTWPISTLWEGALEQAFAVAEDAAVSAAVAPLPEFIEAERFEGAREGYAFKTDDYGVGYYRDEPLPPEIT